MTPQQLKNSILQLAIQGKLVKQISEEGTGEELFKIIQEEKKELIKKGQIRKQKSLPKIKPDEMPFSIPNTWKWIRLVDVGDWGSGGTPLRTNPNYYGGDIPWLKTGDLTDGEVREVSEYITDLALEKTSIRLNPTGSVLMAMYGATIGKLGILTRPMTTNQACCACIVYPNIFNKYLFYFLLASRNYFIKRGEGGAQPNISRAKIIETCMPLPPFEEQKRIVQKIEEMLPLVECYGNAWQKLKELNKKFPTDIQNSILQEAIQGKLCKQIDEDGISEAFFEEIQQKKKLLVENKLLKKQMSLSKITDEEIPFKLSDTWKWVRLGSLINFSIGKTPPRGESEWWGNDFPWVSIADMSDYGYIKETKEMVSKKALDDKFSSISKAGTLLMSFKLTVGRTSILDCDAVHNEAIISIMPYVDHDNSFRDYLFYVLPFLTQWGDSRNAIKGKTLNSKSISKLLIPLPPLAEQKRIVEKIKKILPFINQCRI